MDVREKAMGERRKLWKKNAYERNYL